MWTRVVISCGSEVIARHARSYERDDYVFDPVHYLPLLERKVGSPWTRQRHWPGWELPEEFGVRCAGCLSRGWAGRGKREYVQVLRLMENFRARRRCTRVCATPSGSEP